MVLGVVLVRTLTAMMIVVKLMDQSRLLEQCVRGDRWPKGEQHNRAECPGESHSVDNTNKWRRSQSFFWTDLPGLKPSGGPSPER